MKYKQCNREFLYKIYELSNSIILRLECEADGIPFGVIDPEYEKWRDDVLKHRAYEERVMDVRETIQALMDTVRTSEGIADWSTKEKWLDRIKFFSKGCYRERKKYYWICL